MEKMEKVEKKHKKEEEDVSLPSSEPIKKKIMFLKNCHVHYATEDGRPLSIYHPKNKVVLADSDLIKRCQLQKVNFEEIE